MSTTKPPTEDPRVVPIPGPLGRLGGAAYRHRGIALSIWLVVAGVVIALSTAFAGAFDADYSAPDADSTSATQLLHDRFPAAGNATIDLVAQADGPVTAPATKQRLIALLGQLGRAAHVATVDDPFTTPGAISADGTTARAEIRLTVAKAVDMPVPDTQALIALTDAQSKDGLQVALGGEAVGAAQAGAIGSEFIGLAAAAIILLLTFGTVVAAGLPIITAVAGLAVSSMLTGLIAAVMDVPDWSTSLATMIGLGVGIDYARLMVTRFREWRAAGLDPEQATIATMDTAGRSVVLAGTTVVISMLGLFAMGLSFMRGASVVTIAAVVVVLLASVTLFPALLGAFGARIDRLAIPGLRRTSSPVDGVSVGWLRWSAFVERHRVASALTGLAVLLALAAPFLGARFGFPDAGNDPSGSSTRTTYELTSRAYGPGANAPLVLAVDIPTGTPTTAIEAISTAVAATPGVALVTPLTLNATGDAGVLTVVPSTGPQDRATEDLVSTLRDDVLPRAVGGTGVQVHVGGQTAAAIDSTSNVAKRLPLLIGGVVGLSILLLLVAFRSVAVALKAALMNLLSVAAAYGVVTLVLQGGPVGQLFGIDGQTPLPAFIPVLMFATLFGLSMDYEVFLVARMREAWVATGDNATAVVRGLAGTARVITAAAAIMIAVFAAFIPSSEIVLKVIGIGMASAVLIDATIVRLLLVPAVMHLLGRWNWWLPAWLDGVVPHLHVEGHPHHYLPADPSPARTPATVSA